MVPIISLEVTRGSVVARCVPNSKRFLFFSFRYSFFLPHMVRNDKL